MTDAAILPATSAAPAEAERERLHPMTFVTGLGVALRSAWAGLAASLYFVSQGRVWIAALIVGLSLVGGIVSTLVRYWSFSYRVEPDGIDMASGIFNRTQRSIPFDRIQDVNIEQGLLHRLTGTARVKLETGASAGKADEDGTIDAIALGRADELRDTVRAHRASPVPAAATDELVAATEEPAALFSMGPKRILTLGLFSFSLAIVGALFGVAQTYGDALGFDLFDPDFWTGLLARSGAVEAYVEAHRIVAVLFGVASLALAGFLTGFIRVVPREWNFALQRTETGFRRQRGLFTLTDVVIPLKRVQAAILATGPIRRRRGFLELKVQSLGSDTGNAGDHTLAPLATRPEADDILAAMKWRPVPADTASWHRPRPAFVTSHLIMTIPLIAAIALGISSIVTIVLASNRLGLEEAMVRGLPVFALTILAVAIVAIASRLLDYRHRRHLVDGDRLLVRSGWWRQRLVVLPLARIQSVDLRHHVVDRLFGLAHVRIGVAGGSGFSSHGVEGISPDEAEALRNALLEPAR